MVTTTQTERSVQAIPASYRDNFSRHLLGVARYLQNRMMNTLQDECGHRDLRLGFAPYITLLGARAMRMTQLAETLNISRQACNQAVKQIEAAGYIERKSDPADGRAKQLRLSPSGERLRRDGVRIVADLDQQFMQIVGERAFADTGKTLRKLYRALALDLAGDDAQPANLALGALLPRLSDYILQRLMELTRHRGHPELKLSYGQVLTLIGPEGGRIQHMATVHDVSKQAISAIATELEGLGYLVREADAADARQVVLRLTTEGHKLIEDSVASTRELEAEFTALVGRHAFQRLDDTLRQLYFALQIDREIPDSATGADIGQIARQLQQQLGQLGSQELARLLLNPT